MSPFGTPKCRRVWRTSPTHAAIFYHPRRIDHFCEGAEGHEHDDNRYLRLCRCACGAKTEHAETKPWTEESR